MDSCDYLGGEDQDEAWLDGLVTSVKDKSEALKCQTVWQGSLSIDFAPMDKGNGEEQVR